MGSFVYDVHKDGQRRKCYETFDILQMVGDGFWVFFRPREHPYLKTANLIFLKILWLLLYCCHPETYIVVNLQFFNEDSRGLS